MEKRHGLVFTLLLLITASLWTLTLCKRVETLQLSRSILETERENRELRDEELCLRSRLYRPEDLAQSERAARELGMDKPHREQFTETKSVLPDAAAVLQKDKTTAEKLRELFRIP